MTREQPSEKFVLPKQLKCLIVDASENNALLEMEEFRKGGYDPTWQRVETLEGMESALKQKTWEIVIADFFLLEFSGLEALRLMHEKRFDLPFIVVADSMSEQIALQCLKAGAYAFFKKKNIKLLVPAVERALREVIIKREKKQAEELLRSLTANSPAGVYIVQKGKFVYTNLQFQQYIGYSENELLGMDALSLVFPDDRETVRNNAAQMLKGKRFVPYEFRITNKNGEIKWALESVASIQHQGNRATICSYQDITDRKKAENELHASEERFRIAAESTNDLIWEFDVANGTLKWFGAIDKKLGYSPGEFPRTVAAWEKSIHVDDHDRVMAALDRHLKTAEPYREEFYMKRKNGTFGFWITQGKALLDKQGNPYKIIGACTDITERKQTEAALKEKEERFREVFENSGSGIAIYEAVDNGEDFIYKKVNPVAARIVSMSLENYIGRKMLELYPEGRWFYEILHEVWRTGVAQRQPISHYKDERIEFWIEGHISKMSTGEVVHIFEDVTERKQAVEGLKKAKEAAEAANIAKSDFLARISHEIRTPMNAIMGFIDMLLDTNLTEEQIDFAKTSKRSAWALLSLIDEILDFSKIEAGKMEIESIDFDPELLAYDVCEIIRPRVRNKQIEILCRIGDQVPPKVKGDPGRLRQVLINLMGNAIKFTKAGQIELFCDIEEGTDDRLKLHGFVRDTGVGIPKDKVEIIFDPFQQVDGSTTRKFGGTGLGLSISKQLELIRK